MTSCSPTVMTKFTLEKIIFVLEVMRWTRAEVGQVQKLQNSNLPFDFQETAAPRCW